MAELQKKRGISREQACVLVAVDRNGEVLSQFAGMGRITNQEIADVFQCHLQKVSCLCTDSGTALIAYEKNSGFEYQTLNLQQGKWVKKEIYHIQHVNNYHKRLKEWMIRFNGVVTKYLDHYLTRFRFIEQHKNLSMTTKQWDMFIEAFTHSWHISTQYLQVV